MTGDGPATGCWIYAVQATGGPGVPPGLLGVADEPVRPLEAAGLVAVVATVPLAAIDPGSDTTEDPDADPPIERLAVAHHRVVTALSMTGPLVPFRLGTVCPDEQAVSALLIDRSQQLAAALRLANGCTEWGVKIFLEPPAASQTVAKEAPGDVAGDQPDPRSGAGTAYLLRRRAQRTTADRRRQVATDHADEAHQALAVHADAFSRFQVHDPWTAAHRPWTILSASYLVSEANLDQFTETVAALRRYPGVAVDLTGPWPAYTLGAGAGSGAGSDTGTGADQAEGQSVRSA